MPNITDIVATCFEQVAFFFPGGDPHRPESFVRRAGYLDGRSFARAELCKVLRGYHRKLGAGQAAMANIELLERPDTLAIVTGQQAGFLTGPLYTMYKALTAIRLAAEKSKQLGRPVVPVFWIASEDHDWVEIRETVILNSEGRPVVCRLPGEGKGLSIGELAVPAWTDIYPQLAEALPGGSFRTGTLAALEQFTEQADNLAGWFALILQWLIGDQGLIFFDPMLPEFKQLAKPVYEEILKQHGELGRAFSERTEKLAAQGYPVQIKMSGQEVNLFMACPERRALLRHEDVFMLRGKGEHFSLDALCGLVREEPGRFSPNVVTRPAVQDYLLPTLAYVPGPGECNYWAQLGGVFEALDMRMPILYPRLSVRILLPAWQRTLAKEGLTAEDVYHGLGHYKDEALRAADGFAIDGRFCRLRQGITDAYRELAGLEGLNPQLGELIALNHAKVAAQVEYLEKKVWQAARKRSEGVARRWQQLEEGLIPHGIRQERIVNPLSFVARAGLDWRDQLTGLALTPDLQEQELVLVGH